MTGMDKNMQIKLMLVALIEQYLEWEMTGGILHIHIEDNNFDIDADIEYCKSKNNYFGEVIGMLYNQLSKEDREEVIERGWQVKKVARIFDRIMTVK